MSKSFNEMSRLLKELIKDMNSDAHNARSFREERYHNLKISMDPQRENRPHVIITIGMSEAIYSLETQVRVQGSLGADERYISRWMNRIGIMDSLKDLWRDVENRDKESLDASQLEDIEEIKKKHANDKKRLK